ncbi:MAG: sigma-70 family RNA polymerase sigma factor [Rhizobiales bacterium]|nr:sigma-70 family RNA polymerase sigma factor [Hyphomicrobiales bacterium]OJY41885.1 MAG: RNA polymerase subunit sigma [Rhizobiales bacterium 64-17]
MSPEDELKGLMIASMGGDSTSYQTLLSRLSGHLRAYYKKRLRGGHSIHEVEDLVQEALLAVHTRRHTFDLNEPLTPWVYAIARYKIIDHFRRTRNSYAQLPIETADDVLAQDERTTAESAYDLHRLLDTLPENARRSIQYVKLEGLSVAEASKRSGMSESAIKVNIHRGIQRLSKLMSRRTSHEDQ